ncbi:MaoC family dehydratase [Deinococcus ficus]|uniref:MaoC family dehydratase n=1 Tax=Deinococcus ficus TaxID=317577 RepID=UPI0004846B21|nr:MaoC family dehydratase [Deinococcus ficus]
MTELTLAEFEALVGQEIACTPWVLMTQERIDLFAEATRDRQFIHVDPELAAQGPFGRTIAHGFLTLSLIAGEFLTLGGLPRLEGGGVLLNYGLNKVRFLTPVPVGAHVRNRVVLNEFKRHDGYVQFTFTNTVEIQDAPRPALVAEVIFRWYSKA